MIPDLKWKSHVNNVCAKANKTLFYVDLHQGTKPINLSLDHNVSMPVLAGTPSIKAKSINSKWSNARLQGLSPIESKILEVAQS